MREEEAVRHFYDWEEKGRGWKLFPYPVDIEPIYREFYHFYPKEEYIDDGRVPNIFERLFSKKKIIEKEEFEEREPRRHEYGLFLKQLKIEFVRDYRFDEPLLIEFLNMLSFSEGQISFEIIGNHDSLSLQIISEAEDHKRILHLFKTYFPNTIVASTSVKKLPFNLENKLAIVDFGYNDEFMRPINTSIDSLTGILAVIDSLEIDETVMLQVIWKGVTNPWSRSITNSILIGKDCFFPDSPEMVTCVKEKVSSPLFAVVIRLAVESPNPKDAEKLSTELISNIKLSSRGEYNSLIPLSNVGYQYEDHLRNLKTRGTNRWGMIMNTNELYSFVHFPDSSKLVSTDLKTVDVPGHLTYGGYLIGLNKHLGNEHKVSLTDNDRLKHTHIIGGTGTGKSTLISNLFLEDVAHGNGCIIFDPHGDTIDDIIPRIKESRLKDVILFDPSDTLYSVGINLLSAHTEFEKIVLSSDLAEAFRRHSTSWGDQMTSVLSNAINAFLYSEKGGTLFDLRRFLIESIFRKEFLKTVRDKSIHYYWNNEFVLLKKASISPLLTRLDTFLRPKIIRNILSQKEGLDFGKILNEKKILLVKLPQGLIGEENSYLLGTLILSKIYQTAIGRHKEDRSPIYVYLDEFQNFITPSINSILSGARKFGIGLVLAHQELNQIKDQDILSSVISNANIRICFRLGDTDAKRLENSFHHFLSEDFLNLSTGEAIAKVGRKVDDFSLLTLPLTKQQNPENLDVIINSTRQRYGRRVTDVEEELNLSIPVYIEKEPLPEKEEKILKQPNIEVKSQEYLEKVEEKEELREHRYLQTFIKKIAEQRGFKASIEEEVTGGRIDVSLTKDEIKIACEVAVSNSIDYELKNISKCISAGYKQVCVVSKDEKHLEKIREKISDEMRGENQIHFFSLNQVTEFLDSLTEKPEEKVERIRGYRVKVRYVVGEGRS